jgi:hypothetical protein
LLVAVQVVLTMQVVVVLVEFYCQLYLYLQLVIL